MKRLVDVLKKIDGNVLGIGLDNKYVDVIYINKNIDICNLLETKVSKQSESKKNKFKKIKVKKIKKIFKKKKINYIVCNYLVMKKYINSFIDNSIYICNNKIYFYNVDYEKLVKKYKRYNCPIENINDYLVVDVSNVKNKPFKKILYICNDKVADLVEFIGDLLMN